MKVAVVMGGPSAEYEVSIMTGVQMARHMIGRHELVRIVVISRDMQFFCRDLGSEPVTVAECTSPKVSDGFEGPFRPADAGMVWEGIDVALLGLHGEFGEDGRFQGYLDTLGIPYTGSGVFASSVGMDKIATKRLLLQQGIATPPFSLYGRQHPGVSVEAIGGQHGFPCFAKCPQSGSSRLMGRAADLDELRALLGELSAESDVVLVESTIEGTEISCPVLDYPNGDTSILPIVEIRPVGSAYFDYTAKYTEGASDDIVPARLPADTLQRAGTTALAVHRLLGCSGVSRTDIIVRDDTLYVLEINTLPGFTPLSLVPRSFAATGGTYEELLDILLAGALARKRAGTP